MRNKYAEPVKMAKTNTTKQRDIREILHVSNPRLTSFEDLIKSGFCVDKTRPLAMLMAGGKKIAMLGDSGIGKTVTLSAIEFLAQGNKAKEHLSGYDIILHRWTSEHGNFLDKHGCPIHLHCCTWEDSVTCFPWKKHPVIHIDFENIIHKSIPDTLPCFYGTLQAQADKYNVGHLYKPEMNNVKDDFVKLIQLLSNLGNGYEKKVIILLDNVDNFSENYIRKYYHDDDQSLIDFIHSFYRAIPYCSNIIHTVLAFGGYQSVVMRDLQIYAKLSDETNTPLYKDLFGMTTYELENSFSQDLLIKCFDHKYNSEKQQQKSKEEKEFSMLTFLTNNMKTKTNREIYNTRRVMNKIYEHSFKPHK